MLSYVLTQELNINKMKYYEQSTKKSKKIKIMSKEHNTEDKDKVLHIGGVSSSFKVGTYTIVTDDTPSYCHWSEGLKMVIEKDGVVIKLEGEEIERLVKSLPRTFGGTY